MSPNKRKKRASVNSPLVETPIKVEIEKKDIKERQILEFVPNTIKDGEVVIVRTKKWAGLSEPCFAVANIKGKIKVKQIKEERDKSV